MLTAKTVTMLARKTRYVEGELVGLPDLVSPGGVCFDIGSAAGLYTLALSRLVGPQGRVHSFEPVCFAHPVLTRVLGARSARNVRHHALALGAQPGQGSMSVPLGPRGPVTGRSFLDWNCSGPGSNAEFGGQMEVEVNIQTLDGVCAAADISRLDFVKIDVEGAELHVLRGGQQAIDAFRPAMLIEIEDRHTARYQHSAADVANWLVRRGYQMATWQGRWEEARNICAHARNYLFVPRGWEPPAGRTVALPADSPVDISPESRSSLGRRTPFPAVPEQPRPAALG